MLPANPESGDSRMKALSVAILLMLATALVGCAGRQPATAADVMRGHAADAQDNADLRNELAEKWDQGRKLTKSGEEKVAKGEKQVAKLESDLRKAQEQVAEGRREMAEGTALVQEPEQRFREKFPGLELRAES
jgi:uncharacterized protein HemX